MLRLIISTSETNSLCQLTDAQIECLAQVGCQGRLRKGDSRRSVDGGGRCFLLAVGDTNEILCRGIDEALLDAEAFQIDMKQDFKFPHSSQRSITLLYNCPLSEYQFVVMMILPRLSKGCARQSTPQRTAESGQRKADSGQRQNNPPGE